MTEFVNRPASARIYAVYGLLLINFVWAASAVASTAFLDKDQTTFLEASKALRAGEIDRFHRLARSLEENGYVLYPWLAYEEVRRNLGDSSAVKAFLERYPDTVMAERLRKAWLKYLGERKQWKNFLEAYQEEDEISLRCYYLTASLNEQGLQSDIVANTKKIWLSGKTRPDACNAAFDFLYRHNKLSHRDYWQRFVLATKQGNQSLMKFLEKKLTKSQRRWVSQWKKMKKAPEQTLERALEWADQPESRDIVLDGLQRYARKDVVAAWHLWRSHLREGYSFTTKQINEAERKLALRAAWRHLPEAREMLAQLAPKARNKEVREWRVRSALRHWDWRKALEALDALPKDERKTAQWQYWRARTLVALGHEAEGQSIYQSLLDEPGYYGFLAADKLDQPYRFHHQPVVAEELRYNVEALSQRPAFMRIKELDDIGRSTDAQREWRYETAKLSKNEKRIAAQLAFDWGWHFSAIVTTAAAKHFRDLNLRFPLLYRDKVEREARRQRLPPSFVYGVIRRESAYRASVVSPAGALGLMQLMPATAKAVAKELGLGKMKKSTIKKPDTNIRLGARYLRTVLDRFDDHMILATASYNAGPHRVQKWLPESDALPADIWVDTITFDETRNYVKAVMFYSVIFDWKLDGKVDHRLGERMKPVLPTAGSTVVSRDRSSG